MAKQKHTPDADTTFLTEGIGYQQHKRGGVATFMIEGLDDSDTLRTDAYRKTYERLITENTTMQLQGYTVPLWGDRHNLYPQEVESLIRENKLLPSILRKQEDFLYGKGPMLYRDEVQDDKTVRVPVIDSEITQWLESWEENGYRDYRDYLRALIQDYYRVHTCCSRFHFSRARRIPEMQTGSIRALSYVGADTARLATDKQLQTAPGQTLTNRECRFVAVGNWLTPTEQDIRIYHRFRPDNPFLFSTAVTFNAEQTFARQIYAYNQWFEGLRDWIKASNLTPRYLNSYLKNALNAHVHVRIPLAWVNAQQQNLQELCRQNLNCEAADRVPQYRGVQLIDPKSKKPYRYSITMMEDLIANELEKITKLLAGEGKNQGKLYATTKMGQEGWEFQDFPGKFKEYFDSVISYDKRADQVTLAGLGINSSITNVENDGVISKSGSDVYYNYMVYLSTLSWPEHFICQDINRAIRLNFPRAAAEGIRLGFRNEVPMRQQEVAPKDRL